MRRLIEVIFVLLAAGALIVGLWHLVHTAGRAPDNKMEAKREK